MCVFTWPCVHRQHTCVCTDSTRVCVAQTAHGRQHTADSRASRVIRASRGIRVLRVMKVMRVTRVMRVMKVMRVMRV